MENTLILSAIVLVLSAGVTAIALCASLLLGLLPGVTLRRKY